MQRCLFCNKKIKGITPYSVCYDPDWEKNVWGGDTHEYIGHLCASCGKKIKEEAKTF